MELNDNVINIQKFTQDLLSRILGNRETKKETSTYITV